MSSPHFGINTIQASYALHNIRSKHNGQMYSRYKRERERRRGPELLLQIILEISIRFVMEHTGQHLQSIIGRKIVIRCNSIRFITNNNKHAMAALCARVCLNTIICLGECGKFLFYSPWIMESWMIDSNFNVG